MIKFNKSKNNMLRIKVFCNVTRSECPDVSNEHMPSYSTAELKVKVTLVQALRLCTGSTAHRGSRGIALPFHDHGTRRR